MDRRSFIKKTGLVAGGAAVAAASTFPKPAIAQDTYNWSMVTTWPTGLPGLYTGAERFAQRVNVMSEGRLNIRVYGAGELVPAFESFDAVTTGTAEMMHATPYYWQGNHQALGIFTSIPFGLLDHEHTAWMHYGGGQELWDELYGEFGIKAWHGGDTTAQMAGWFPREINSLDDIQGLSFRTAGVGTEVWRRVGLNVQTTPAGEIFAAMQSGALDAAEWVGPWNDLALGLYQVHKYYYYPSIIEPHAALEIAANREAYEGLPSDLQLIIEVAANAEHNLTTADFNANNQAALETLVNEHDVQVLHLPDDVIEALAQASAEAITELRDSDDISRRIVDSMAAWREPAVAWTNRGVGSFAATRLKDIPFPA